MMHHACTCFAASSAPCAEDLLRDATVVSNHPFAELGLALGFHTAEGGEGLILANPPRTVYRASRSEPLPRCPVHGVPPLSSPSARDLLALDVFFGRPQADAPPASIIDAYPIFATLNKRGDVLWSDSPCKSLHHVGTCRDGVAYVFGAGGFSLSESDGTAAIETAVTEYISQRRLSCMKTKQKTTKL